MSERHMVYLQLWNGILLRHFFHLPQSVFKEQFGQTCPKVNKRKMKKGEYTWGCLLLPTSSLSHSLIGMDKILLSVYIDYTFFIFSYQAASWRLFPLLDLFNFLHLLIFNVSLCLELSHWQRSRGWLEIYSFLNPSNGVIVIRTFQPLF